MSAKPDLPLLTEHRPLTDRLLGKGTPDAAVDAILKDPLARASADVSEPIRWGRWVLLVAGLLLLLWGALAPLAEGIPVSGFLKVEGNSKSIQHIKGGIVEDIAVKEGDVVKAGQTLMRLNDVQLKAQLGMIEAQLVSVLAVNGRLQAERDSRADVSYPAFLTTRQQDDAAQAMRLQNQLFASRRGAMAIEEAGTLDAIKGLEQQIGGIQAQEQAKAEQLRLFKEEYDSLKPMYEQGFVPRNRMFELERAMAMLSGQRSEDIANIGRARSQIAEARQRILLTRENYRKEVETLLTDANKQVGDLTQRQLATLDDLGRVVINSPVAGTVAGLTVFTLGGVIGPGQRIMDIVPGNLPLVIEVMIPTHLIDNVHVGLSADVHFVALDRMLVPVIEGQLVYVSADRQQMDPARPDLSHFVGRISVNQQEMAKLGKHALQAGMPAEVVIKTGERTLLGYLIRPLLSRLPFAFKER
jgi:protease secretion system membrane fusion protein